MELLTGIEGSPHDVVSRHMNQDNASKDPEKFLLSNLHGFLELAVLADTWLAVPRGIETGDSAGEVGRIVVSHVLGGSITHTIVHAVDLKNEFIVEALKDAVYLCLIEHLSPLFAGINDDFFTVVFVDETCTGQLGDVFGGVVGP